MSLSLRQYENKVLTAIHKNYKPSYYTSENIGLLLIYVNNKGKVTLYKILRSCGNRKSDNEIIKAVKKSQPFLKISNLEDKFVIPIIVPFQHSFFREKDFFETLEYKLLLKEGPKHLKKFNTDNSIKVIKDLEKYKIKKASKNIKKLISLNPNDSFLHILSALCYNLEKDYTNGLKYLETAVEIDSGNKIDNLIEFTQKRINNSIISRKMASKEVNSAPEELYKLTKYPITENKRVLKRNMKMLIDYLWSDKDGKKLLSYIHKSGVKIKFTRSNPRAHTVYSFQNHYNIQLKDGSENPKAIIYGQVNIKPYIYLNIEDLRDFEKPNTSLYKKVKLIMAFVHEMLHSIARTEHLLKENSIYEEVMVSLVGFNIAHRITYQKELNKDETYSYIHSVLMAYLDKNKESSEKLKNLNNFDLVLKGLQIELPHNELYETLRYSLKEKTKNN